MINLEGSQILIRWVDRSKLPPNTRIGRVSVSALGPLLNISPRVVPIIKAMKPTVELSISIGDIYTSTGYFNLE